MKSSTAILAAAALAFGALTPLAGLAQDAMEHGAMTAADALSDGEVCKISRETGKGEFAMGIALGLVLLLLAFAVNLTLSLARKRATRWTCPTARSRIACSRRWAAQAGRRRTSIRAACCAS